MPYEHIVILTGAGISAESGLATFRDSGGLWEGHRVEDVATPEAFRANPVLVHQFYNLRRAQLAHARPNAAHRAIAEFASRHTGSITLITQNVDDLHERAEQGFSLPAGYALLHMHGELKKARCTASDEIFPWETSMDTATLCPCCQTPGRLRTHIVWFGEMPLYMELIEHHLRRADLFISIGTSGNVYPAAGFVQQVRYAGHAHTVELNMEPSLGHSLFQDKRYGPASEIVPSYFSQIAQY
jgi:NAD-dependent deacetylase